MTDICTNGGLDAFNKTLSSNKLFVESWENCLSLGLGVNGKVCPFDLVNKEKYCSKGSADEVVASIRKIMIECHNYSWDIEMAYYEEKLNIINMCSKDLRTGKECNNIPTTIGSVRLKKFFFMKPLQWDTSLCESTCSAEYDTLYREFGYSIACNKFEDNSICETFQAGNSTCVTVTSSSLKHTSEVLAGIFLFTVFIGILFVITCPIVYIVKWSKKRSKKMKRNVNNNSNSDDGAYYY